MSGPAVILVFGIACSSPCAANAVDLDRIEKAILGALESRGWVLQVAPHAAQRPTGALASPEVVDEAERHGVDRVLAVDLESSGQVLWMTHFVRGVVGPWSVGKASCVRSQRDGGLECPDLDRVLASGLRARTREDVDFVSALRFQAARVGACIEEEDRVPIEERIFGRVEIDLQALPTGEVRVLAIAPALVARAPLGRCLRRAMESMNVGPYEGEPAELRVPIDLD